MYFKIHHWLLILFIIVTVNSCTSFSSPKDNSIISGTIVKVIDGDTYDLRINAHHTIRIKMEGIDAPEKGMPFYKESKKYLKEMCLGKTVYFKPNGSSKYEKMIGFTYVDDKMELSYEMLKAGMAWYNKKLNSNNNLYKTECQAKAEHRGLWSVSSPVPPHNFRKSKRCGIPLKYIQNI